MHWTDDDTYDDHQHGHSHPPVAFTFFERDFECILHMFQIEEIPQRSHTTCRYLIQFFLKKNTSLYRTKLNILYNK